MAVRLGFDIGIASLGSCAMRLPSREARRNPNTVLSALPTLLESHVVLSPDFGERAQSRQAYRRAAKTKNHKLQRLEKLRRMLTATGFYPKDPQDRIDLHNRKGNVQIVPAQVLVKGYDEKVDAGAIGIALLWASKKRGQRSAANAEKNERDEDDGIIQTALIETEDLMKRYNCRTIHEFMATRPDLGDAFTDQSKPNTMRLEIVDGEKRYAFAYNQAMAQESLTLFLNTQAKYYPEIDERFIDRVLDLSINRNMTSRYLAGYCRYDPRRDTDRERRLRADHPMAFRLKAYQYAGNARVVTKTDKRKLSPNERDAIVDHLYATEKPSISGMKELLGLKASERFIYANDDDSSDTHIPRNTQAVACKAVIGASYDNLTFEQQCALTEPMAILDHKARAVALAELSLPLSQEDVQALATSPQIKSGYISSGLTSTTKIVAQMMSSDEVVGLYDAVLAAGYDDPSSDISEERLTTLPYYGKVLTGDIHNQDYSADIECEIEKHFGRISNPVVHGQLNALRREYNRMVIKHGRPAEVVIELTRDLRNKLTVEQAAEEKKEGDKRSASRAERLKKLKVEDSPTNRKKFRLAEHARKWGQKTSEKNQAKACMVCVTCGKDIPDSVLFAPNEIEYCHIFPRSKTNDDSLSNLFLGCRDCNKKMGNLAPQEVADFQPHYDEIVARAKEYYPKSTAWRFARGAHLEYINRIGGFTSRNMNDTSWFGKLASKYIKSQFDPAFRHRVRTTRGLVTAVMRNHWGLEDWLVPDPAAKKGETNKRHDHRHHALDAIVIALTNRAMTELVRKAHEDAEDLFAKTGTHRHNSFRNFLPKLPAEYLAHLKEVFDKTEVDQSYKYSRYLKGGEVITGQVKGDLSMATTYSPNVKADDPTLDAVRQTINLSAVGFQPVVPIDPAIVYSRGRGGKSRKVPSITQVFERAKARHLAEKKPYYVVLREEAEKANLKKAYYFETSVKSKKPLVDEDATVADTEEAEDTKKASKSKLTGLKKRSSMVTFETKPNLVNRVRARRGSNNPPSEVAPRIMQRGSTAYAVLYYVETTTGKRVLKTKRTSGVNIISAIEAIGRPPEGSPRGFPRSQYVVDEKLPAGAVVLARYQKGDRLSVDYKGVVYDGFITSIGASTQIKWTDTRSGIEIPFRPCLNTVAKNLVEATIR